MLPPRTTTFILLLAALGSLSACSHRIEDPPLPVAQKIPLGDVQGRLDHLAVDPLTMRLFVAAYGGNSVEVLSLAASAQMGSIPNLSQPQDVLFLEKLDRLLVSCGGDGTVRSFQANDLKPISTTYVGEEADNMRFDAAANALYVGYGAGAIAALDVQTGEKIGDIVLPGHPEGFVLQSHGPRIFVNVPTAAQVAVVDRQKMAIVETWPLQEAASNFPMALDEQDERLFIGCRKPAAVLVLDTLSGRTVAVLPCVADADDLFYDPVSRRIFISGGEGWFDIYQQTKPDTYALYSHTPTAIGARTSLFVAPMKMFYVAIPQMGIRTPEIWGYSVP